MATKFVVELYDDLDGSPAAETVRFGLDGTAYEVELSAGNARALRAVLDPVIACARRVQGRPARSTATTFAIAVNNRAVRVWAAINGITVRSRGRIPAGVLKRYRTAGH